MFTGLIEGTGRAAQAVVTLDSGGRIRIESLPWDAPSILGESIAVNGACLTVAAAGQGWFEADVSQETASRTNLGDLPQGALVNLERPLRVGDRLGGHWVLGHVDGLGKLEEVISEGDFRRLTFSLPSPLARYVVEKGSIAVDGVSLTVASLVGNAFEVAVIPKTWEATNLSDRKIGDRVNIETDILAKHVERFLLSREPDSEGITEELLREKGFL